jgi:hypothetical protein
VSAAQSYVQDQPVQNVDETRWPGKTERAWLWISTAHLVMLFLVSATRRATGVQQLIGRVVKSIVGTEAATRGSILRGDRCVEPI